MPHFHATASMVSLALPFDTSLHKCCQLLCTFPTFMDSTCYQFEPSQHILTKLTPASGPAHLHRVQFSCLSTAVGAAHNSGCDHMGEDLLHDQCKGKHIHLHMFMHCMKLQPHQVRSDRMVLERMGRGGPSHCMVVIASSQAPYRRRIQSGRSGQKVSAANRISGSGGSLIITQTVMAL